MTTRGHQIIAQETAAVDRRSDVEATKGGAGFQVQTFQCPVLAADRENLVLCSELQIAWGESRTRVVITQPLRNHATIA